MSKKYPKSDLERLARECAKLDPQEEKQLAEEFMSSEIDLPSYEEEIKNEDKPKIDLLGLASQVYDGLSLEDINEIEQIALDCSNFFKKKAHRVIGFIYMFFKHDYQLLDFGQARRLERFGDIVLDRACPAAEKSAKGDPSAWNNADAFFKDCGEAAGQWIYNRELSERWTIAHGPLQFELKRTPFGHIGLFPEQAENWDWIAARGKGRGARDEGRGQGAGIGGQEYDKETLKVLNLFAYTGGSTLAAAAAGMEVVHVDAANNIVDWARRNAELSGLADAPIHWITEDAMKFVQREVKRCNNYDAVILDPPSYGHGRRGEVWRLSKDLPQLLDLCAELTAGQCRFVLLTSHTPGYDSARLADMLLDTFPNMQKGKIEAKALTIRAATGQELPSGELVRWTP